MSKLPLRVGSGDFKTQDRLYGIALEIRFNLRHPISYHPRRNPPARIGTSKDEGDAFLKVIYTDRSDFCQIVVHCECDVVV